MQKPCCHFHKMWLSLCPPLPDLYWKDERKGNLDDFILITLSLNDWWFCHRSTGKTVRKQLIKADDFLSKCISSNWILEQKCILLFFSSPESPLHYAEEAWSYFFPNPFSFCFSCTVHSYLNSPLHHCYAEWVSGVWALPKQALSCRLLASENKSLAERQTNGVGLYISARGEPFL